MLNLTPHQITVIKDDGTTFVFDPSGTVARVSTVEEVVGVVGGVPVPKRTFESVVGLPPEGTPCIVSAMVLAAAPGRAGVYAPDSGATAVRNEKGHIVAVKRLIAA